MLCGIKIWLKRLKSIYVAWFNIYKMSHRFKIIINLFLISSILLVSGLGCKGLSKQEKAATKSIALEYWTVNDDVDQIKDLISKYTLSRPYLTVSVRQLTESELYSRLIEALAEDQSPDIISIHNRMLPAFYSKLAVMPSSVTDATVQTIQGKLRKEAVINMSAQNLPSVWQIDGEYVQVVKKDVIYNGQIYGLPLSVDTMALYYNKDLLDRAGIAQPPKTWNEFQTAVKKITKYDATGKSILQAGTAFGTGSNIEGFDDLLFVLFEQSNVSFTSNNRMVFNLSSSAGSNPSQAISVMNFYTDFANPSKDTYSWNETMNNSLNDFIAGKVGFFFGYSYHNALIKARAPQLNVRILPLPQLNGDKPVNVANYWVQTVVRKSSHQNEAWGLINHLAHSSATKEYLDKTGRPSALRTYITEQQQKKELEPFVSQLLVAENWYRGKSYGMAKSSLSYMLSQWLKVPAADSGKQLEYWQDLLNHAAAQINQTL